MDKRFSKRVFYLLLALISLIAGCNAPKNQLARFNNSFRADYTGAFSFEQSTQYAESKISNSKKPKGEDLLWSMQLGCLERIKQNHQQSSDYFDKSEEMLNFFDYRSAAADSVAATAVSENVVPYVGEEYDGIMVNTYKALNFMTLGQDDLARVEFNRALDRQRRAKEKFAQEIAKLKDELEQAEKDQKKGKSNVKKSVENPEVEELISNRYPSLYEFEAYPDFVNPFTTYIAGVYFNLVGDHSKAATLLKESYGMVSGNDYVAQDMVVTERILDGQEQLRDTVWVIFENGMGPVKEEFRIDIPLFLVTDKVKYVGIALPKLEFRQQAYPYLSVTAAGTNYGTQLIADMDRVVQTEFKKDFRGILTRAIISATAKAIAQYALEEKGSSFASLAVALYSAATTVADVRIWTTLPKDFQVARLPIPADRILTVEPPNAAPFQVEIPACRNAVVYIRIPFKQARAVYDLITY
ncbi:MAG: hypothetical protein JSU70_02325 [Phycisphaerales bacterium]|nr:MAG: hypothetical protein JSU70_02325 [Phycisphaerales bacterium]